VELDEKDISKKFSTRRVLIPIFIGLCVSIFLLVSNLNDASFVKVANGLGDYEWVDTNNNGAVDFSNENEFIPQPNGNYNRQSYNNLLSNINWTGRSWFWLFIALCMMIIRDLAYMFRIRFLTDKQLSWKQSFNVVMMWEFASSLTPSVVGGTGIALFIVNREGINMGRSTAVVLITAMMDNLFYLIMVPAIILIVGTGQLFPFEDGQTLSLLGMELNVFFIFWAGYSFIFLLTLVIILAIFINPIGLKRLLANLFKLKLLKRWRRKAIQTGSEVQITSKELKGKPFKYWLKGLLATFFSWTARYWIVNFLILAFTSKSLAENLIIYARQLAMWVIMLVSPTPGGSGVAEMAFSVFLEEFVPLGFAALLAILWRLISYYPYLFIGSFILPRWLKSTSKTQ